jgi:dTDP-4-dehydrorhamnose 3,5-epimerase
MHFIETKLSGAYLIEPELLEDSRGFFARTWCRRELQQRGLNPRLAQCSISFNKRKGTLRGMHYQTPPFAEVKLVRCTMGAVHDVIVDLRPESTTFKEHLGVELTALNRLMLYIPEGFAHGFVTLEDNTEVLYQMSEFYSPSHAKGFRWNDPAFKIPWPIEVHTLSDRDRDFPDFDSQEGDPSGRARAQKND